LVSGAERLVLPSGEAVWVQLPDDDLDRHVPPTDEVGDSDVGLGSTAAQLLQVPGLVETVQGVVGSVRMALETHRPDTVQVEFGLELSGKTGAVLSLLGEAGGKAHVKITASWDGRSRRDDS
jgi:hypothetical protein